MGDAWQRWIEGRLRAIETATGILTPNPPIEVVEEAVERELASKRSLFQPSERSMDGGSGVSFADASGGQFQGEPHAPPVPPVPQDAADKPTDAPSGDPPTAADSTSGADG